MIRRAFAVAALVVVVLLGVVALVEIWRNAAFVWNAEHIRFAILGLGPLAPLGLIALGVLQIVVAPIPGYLVQGAGGYLFGPVAGSIYGILGMLLGATLAFVLARRFGAPLLERVLPSRLDRYWDRLRWLDSSIAWVVILLLPIGDFVYFLAGLTALPLWRMLLLTLIVRGPSVILAALVGAEVADLSRRVIVVSAAVIVLLSILVLWQKDRLQDLIYDRILPHILGRKGNPDDQPPADRDRSRRQRNHAAWLHGRRAYCGLKSPGPGKLDLAILSAVSPCTAAGVFTTNRMKAAPVQLCQDRLAQSPQAQAVIVNSGIANAGTGQQGLDIAEGMAEAAGAKLRLPASLVLVASTGKIGWQIPLDKVRTGVENALITGSGGHDAARAIMTTDTRPKEIAVSFKLENRGPGGRTEIFVAGMGKGAGMIHPQMATLLAFVTTDAAVEPVFLRQALRRAADRSFNMISIDGDMSTNDTLLILASGLAGNEPIRQGTVAARLFEEALDAVCLHLAKEMARDGEGATRLVEVTVRGAVSLDDARRAARTIVSSNLTKCAIHGADPNWGRIAAAAGRSGALMDQARLDVCVGDIDLMKDGTPLAYDAAAASSLLSRDAVAITVDFHLGLAQATAWGCDMSEEYVTFNSDYTT